MGIYIYKGYHRKVGFTTGVISLVWFVLSIKVFLPYFNGAGYSGLSYGYGLSQHKIDVFISRLFTRETGQYLFYLLGPVAFLSILSPLLLFVSSPIFVSDLLGSPYMRTINYQYTALIIPFIFLSAIYGGSRLYKLFNFRKKEQIFIALLLVSAFFSSYYIGPTPLSKTRPQYFITDRVKVTNLGLDLIPPKAAVSADPFLVPHLSTPGKNI